MKNTIVQFANEGGGATTLLVEIANELKIGEDGWAHIAPLGDHPGMALVDDGKGGFTKQKATQRIDKEACTQMANEFAASRKGAKRYLAGRPIYIGHPDVPGMDKKYPDKSPKGVFSNIAVRDDGLWGEPVLTDEGSELIEGKKYRALSGRWNAEPAGEENGVKIYRPSVFLSAGLTNQPNLPVQLLNEKDDGPVNTVPAPSADAPKVGDTETPADRAEKMSAAAHDLSGKAHAFTRKATISNTAADHVAAFHGHAAAQKGHMEASNLYKTGEFKNDGIAGDHDEMAEAHLGQAVRHARFAKKAGAADADMANEKDLFEVAKGEATPENYQSRKELKEGRAKVEKSAATERATIMNEMSSVRDQLKSASGTVDTLKLELETVRTELSQAKVQRDGLSNSFANERAARIEDALGLAVEGGKITYAERATWRTRLENQTSFANELQNLRTLLRTKVKVVPVTLDHKGVKVELLTGRAKLEKIEELKAEICNENKWDIVKDYDKAFNLMCQRFPDLMGVGNEPQIKRK